MAVDNQYQYESIFGPNFCVTVHKEQGQHINHLSILANSEQFNDIKKLVYDKNHLRSVPTAVATSDIDQFIPLPDGTEQSPVGIEHHS